MLVRACAAVLVLVVVGVASMRTDVEGETALLECADGYVELAGKCFKFHQDRRTRADALRRCQGEGAQLASVLLPEEYSALLDHINANYPGTYWTSGITSSDTGNWIWMPSGRPVEGAWWGRSPNTRPNQCAYFCSNTRKYWDKACTYPLRYICEKDVQLTVINVQPEQERYQTKSRRRYHY